MSTFCAGNCGFLRATRPFSWRRHDTARMPNPDRITRTHHLNSDDRLLLRYMDEVTWKTNHRDENMHACKINSDKSKIYCFQSRSWANTDFSFDGKVKTQNVSVPILVQRMPRHMPPKKLSKKPNQPKYTGSFLKRFCALCVLFDLFNLVLIKGPPKSAGLYVFRSRDPNQSCVGIKRRMPSAGVLPQGDSRKHMWHCCHSRSKT